MVSGMRQSHRGLRWLGEVSKMRLGLTANVKSQGHCSCPAHRGWPGEASVVP